MSQTPIIAIGQFPPPFSGFSHITHCVTEAMGELGPVQTIDIAAPRGSGGVAKHLGRLKATWAACGKLLRARTAEPRPLCYIACEGGLGLVYTLQLVICARLAGLTTLLHHHSFAYIDQAKGLMKRVVGAQPRLHHVFLCRLMQQRFEQVYGPSHAATVLSNAAFVPPMAKAEAEREQPVLGHLSNLTREKGLYLFLDLLRATPDLRGVLAGPIALAEDKAAVEQAVADLQGRLDYRGALYGAEKDRFYRDIDIFIFPTRYVNEAQPTVLFEAQAAGCRFASYDRGCIANQRLSDDLIVPQDQDFVAAVTVWINTLPEGDTRAARLARYGVRHEAARAVIPSLLTAPPLAQSAPCPA
ncbi:glycosyltransferase family 4 protein [Novosphingobium terrae]|uniref:glycosyltransferase family 4 protein n=1 Tax=Novosphingobium terrae TaxID=2726189 RepID=UPI0019817D65|nr:glycosyltransferase family 4 protein [Novosphingobium terrae]